MASGKKRPKRRGPVRRSPSSSESAPAAGHPFSPALVGVLLAAATFAVYAGVLRNGFVSYDDEVYVVRNAHVRSGLTAGNAAWSLTATEAANWHPLTWMSHMADVSLWGMRPGGHHATSVFLHAANALLVFLLLRRGTGAAGRSAAAALLFALHPLRVESVAWVAERKDVLSTFFGLAAIGAWAAWVRRRQPGAYAASLALFAASLMSKATFVTLPFLLLILDFWPLERIGPARKLEPAAARSSLSRVLLEKAPYLFLSAVASLITLRAQRAGGATAALPVALLPRVENAIVACARYLGKIFWPTDLAVLYPHTAASLGWKTWAAGALLAAISAAAIALRRRHPYLLAGWIWYLVALLPVIGLVQVGWQSIADRYTYVPSLGIGAAIVWTIAETAPKRLPRPWLAAAPAAVLLALSVLTLRQVATWRDSLALYEHAVAVTGPNETMQIDLGNELARRGRTEEAARHFSEALRIAPGSKDSLYALGRLALDRGRYGEARGRFAEVLRLHPDFAEAEVQTAMSYIREKRPADAVPHAGRALGIRPAMPDALYVLGSALDTLGRTAEAKEQYEAAIAARPDYAEAHQNLGDLLVAGGRTAEAIPHFEAALRANPDFAEARQSLEAARRAVR
jgi:tetratricopeptide (TPR) repeat protein